MIFFFIKKTLELWGTKVTIALLSWIQNSQNIKMWNGNVGHKSSTKNKLFFSPYRAKHNNDFQYPQVIHFFQRIWCVLNWYLLSKILVFYRPKWIIWNWICNYIKCDKCLELKKKMKNWGHLSSFHISFLSYGL